MAARGIVRIMSDEDVIAPEETKVHTFSQRAIAEMLDVAARVERESVARPPPAPRPSGVRMVDGRRVAIDPDSACLPAMPGAAGVPQLWDDDEEGLDPTRLSERVSAPRLPLETQLLDAAVVLALTAPPKREPEQARTVRMADRPALAADARPLARDPIAAAITLATFLATLLPGLWAVHWWVAR